tara:strand:+ start:1215 stop:1457 length:243 start_codon:yes stop_codon:yes gene_type:complete
MNVIDRLADRYRAQGKKRIVARAPASLLGGFDAVAPAESSKTARCDSQGGGRVCIARIDTGCALDGFSGDGGFGSFLSPH